MAEEKKTTLEEAAEKFVYDWAGLSPTERRIAERAYLAGADWQAERLLKASPMPEDTVIFQKGIEEGKRLMMEDAVEGFIFQSADYYPKRLIASYDGELGMGDKVKIIIVKEDSK